MNRVLQGSSRNLLLTLALACLPGLPMAGPDQPTEFTTRDSIVNTRHNLTQSTMQNGQGSQMNSNRNNYGEVCVYCHTPHGANSQIDAPLWNRTFLSNTYTTYDTLGTATLSGTVTQPGINSLTCLSCHDGTTAVDSIINMPGSGQYNAAQETSQNEAFLDGFTSVTGNGTTAGSHAAMNETGCLACHVNTGIGQTLFADAPDFTVFKIGTDLTNDHPVGVNLPVTKLGVEFNDPAKISSNSKMRYFDLDGDSHADRNEIRFYDTGDGFEVECASCHDPHGVPASGNSGPFNPTFLRVSNDGSGVCLTCHIK